jgi:hypothetical protein
LSLARDSGAFGATTGTPLWTSSTEGSFTLEWDTFRKLGWVGSYTLDYGDAFSGCSCITEIRTSVDRYRTAADAKSGLAFWKKDDAQVVRLDRKSGFAVAAHRFLRVPAVGTSRYAYFTQYETVRAKPVWMVDERFADGKYVLQVEISWGSGATGTTLAPKLAKKLDERLQLARAGRLHATAATLPRQPAPGAQPGAPDLSTLVLQQSDLAPGVATLTYGSGHYARDAFALALSEYDIVYEPAGRYAELGQTIQWYPSANEAAFRSAYHEALGIALAAGSGIRGPITSVDLGGVGHGDRGAILRTTRNGYLALLSLSRGRATDYVFAQGPSRIRPADVQGLAQSMAARLAAGVAG